MLRQQPFPPPPFLPFASRIFKARTSDYIAILLAGVPKTPKPYIMAEVRIITPSSVHSFFRPGTYVPTWYKAHGSSLLGLAAMVCLSIPHVGI